MVSNGRASSLTIFGAESLEEISDEERASDEETASDEEIASDDEVSCDEEEIVDDEEISGDFSEEELVAVSETDELISVSSANVICSDEDDPSQATISVAAAAVKIASVFFILVNLHLRK